MLRTGVNMGARRTFALLTPRQPAPVQAFSRPALMFTLRGMANKPDGKDASGVFRSAKDELKNVSSDLAKTISGNVSRDMPEAIKDDVAAVTRECE
jgi:hypothetical protein